MSADNRSEPGLSSSSWKSLEQGGRFVVRHRLASGDSHPLTDVVGDVESVSENSVSLRTRRRGLVHIARDSITALKQIPATPGRRGQRHRAISIDDLERLAVDGWVPLHQANLGSWVLRCADGYTGRANSALAVGQPDRPLPATFNAITEWYQALDQPPLVQVPLSPGCAPDDDALVAEASLHGWEWFQLTDFMTAATSEVRQAAQSASQLQEAAGAEAPQLVASSSLSDDWWSLADERMLESPAGARAVLTGSPDQEFFVLSDGATPVARARIAFAHGWGGIFAVSTRSDLRGRGLGSRLIDACAQAAHERGIASLYLQVSADNSAAISLYTRLGFIRHHQYVYLRHAEPAEQQRF